MRRILPSLTALQAFEAAARTQNFSQAAKLMNMSQSALSRQIALLEAHLQHPLFRRERQRVFLTQAGARLLEDLTPCLTELETILFRASSQSERRRALNIGVYPTLGARWLNPILVALSERDARTTFNTITYLSNDDIDPALVDLAIVQGDPPFAGFVDRFLMPETLVAVASPEVVEAPISDPQQLLRQRVLQHVTRPLSWPIWFDSLGAPLEVVPAGPMFSQFEMLIDAVVRGLGVAIVPKVLVAKDLAAGRLVLAHPHEARPPSGYHLLVPVMKSDIAKIQRLGDALIEAAPQA